MSAFEPDRPTLFITETTVKAHMKSIFAKLNVLSRTEAIAAAAAFT